MDNVPAIKSKKFSHTTGNAIARVEEHYILSKWLLTTSDYGVPQKRQIAICVGSKLGEIEPPLESNRKFNVGGAIADLSHIVVSGKFPLKQQLKKYLATKAKNEKWFNI